MAFLLLAYLATLVLWPFYIDYRLLPSAGINPQRILAFAFAALFMLTLVISGFQRSLLKHYALSQPTFFLLLFSYFLWRAITALASQDIGAVFLVVYEVVSYLAIFLGVLIYISHYNRHGLFFRLLAILTTAIFAICLIEYALGSNPFAKFASQTERLAISATEILRAGSHRVKATFEHPLTLVQFVAISLPLLWISGRSTLRHGSRQLLVLACVAMLLMTKSRSALVLLGVVFWYYVWTTSRATPNGISPLRFSLVIGAAGFLIGGYLVLSSVDDSLYGRSLFESEARAAQIHNGVIAIAGNPILGYGPGVAAGEVLYGISQYSSSASDMWEANATTVDNRYLSVAIESGVPGLLLFLAISWIPVWRAHRLLIASGRKGIRDANWDQLFGAQIACLGALVTMLILSIFTVHSLFFVALSLHAFFFQRLARLSTATDRARLSSP